MNKLAFISYTRLNLKNPSKKYSIVPAKYMPPDRQAQNHTRNQYPNRTRDHHGGEATGAEISLPRLVAHLPMG